MAQAGAAFLWGGPCPRRDAREGRGDGVRREGSADADHTLALQLGHDALAVGALDVGYHARPSELLDFIPEREYGLVAPGVVGRAQLVNDHVEAFHDGGGADGETAHVGDAPPGVP